MISFDGSYVTIHTILLLPISILATIGFLYLLDTLKDIAKTVYDDWSNARALKKWRDK